MMMHALTPGQATMIRRRPYCKDMYFNPVQDIDGNWFVSVEEVSQCINPTFQWVKTLPLVPYVEPPRPEFP